MKSKIQKSEAQQAIMELIRVGDWIRWSASLFEREKLFFGHGTDNAWDEAVQLVLQILHLPVSSDPLVFHATVITREREELLAAIAERVERRKPLPYITRQAWCMGLPFYVDERVLIPRSPFAEWIEKQFQPWVRPENVHNILEIGTGSACLAIVCALAFPHAQVDAIDIDGQALEVAKINVERHQLHDQVTLIQSNGFNQVPGKRYDIIFSNPPYVSHDEMATLPPEYHHEPRGALEASQHGLAVALDIISNASHYLQPEGVLFVEVGNADQALMKCLPQAPFIWLEQERGGHGLFMLTKQQLDELQEYGGK